MYRRILEKMLVKSPKSVLLLGPRQVGKSTLCSALGADLYIQLADEETFTSFVKDPGRLRRLLDAKREVSLVVVDEIQRIPSLLNTIQAIVDSNPSIKFVLTGSSARKLKRGRANLMPGRLFHEFLPPLVFWEIEENFDLERAIQLGMLPEIYDKSYGADLLESYVTSYLREEIQSEALTKNIGSYARFVDLAAELSGQYLNYAKIGSDSEINKETIRRYMEILDDTLLIERLESYTEVPRKRKARQKEKFYFFDNGVRNALLNRHKVILSKEERGALFEHWFILQVIYYNKLHHKNWKLSTYRDAAGLEVDLIIDRGESLWTIEIKSSQRVGPKAFKNLVKFETYSGRSTQKFVVHQGADIESFGNRELSLPYQNFLSQKLSK